MRGPTQVRKNLGTPGGMPSRRAEWFHDSQWQSLAHALFRHVCTIGGRMNPVIFQQYRDAISRDDHVQARALLGEIVVAYEPLVTKCARHLSKGDFEDLAQAGRLALLDAVEVYEQKDGSFPALARMKILSAMHRDVVSVRDAVVDPSRRWSPTTQRLRRAIQAFAARTGRAPTADDLGIPRLPERDAVKMVLTENFEGVGGSTYAEMSTTDTTPMLSAGVLDALVDLSTREMRIVLSHVLDGKDFSEIAIEEGIRKQPTLRAYNRAMDKLRRSMGVSKR